MKSAAYSSPASTTTCPPSTTPASRHRPGFPDSLGSGLAVRPEEGRRVEQSPVPGTGKSQDQHAEEERKDEQCASVPRVREQGAYF